MNRDYDNVPDEINVRSAIDLLWTHKWLIAAITTAFAIASVTIAVVLPNIYRAEAYLAPNDPENLGLMSALADQYGGLAALAGIDLTGGGIDKTVLGLEILSSKKFVMTFIDDHNLAVPLVAVKDWDRDNDRLIIDSEIYDVQRKTWVRDVKPPKLTRPSSQELYEELMDILSVSQDKRSGIIRVSIDYYSPKIAKEWVDLIVHDLNHTVMQHDVAKAQQAIDFLNSQLERTSVADLRQVFFDLIEEQMKTIVLANVSQEYLFETIDPALVQEEKFKPRRALIAITGTLFGGLIALIVIGIRSQSPRRASGPSA